MTILLLVVWPPHVTVRFYRSQAMIQNVLDKTLNSSALCEPGKRFRFVLNGTAAEFDNHGLDE
jgi:hypothetical protein